MDQQLFVQDDTGSYVEYTPPDPPAFHDTLPEDVRGSEHLKEVSDNAQLARYYVDLKSNQVLPPEGVDSYSYDIPEGIPIDETALAGFKEFAFKNGFSQDQYSQLMEYEITRQRGIAETMEKRIADSREAAEAELKRSWGDEYEARLEKANSVLRHEALGDEDFTKFLQESNFGNHPQVIKYFERLSRKISEGVLVKEGSGGDEDKRPIGEDGRPRLRFPSMETKTA